MKKIIIVIAGLMVCFGAVVGYGQEKAVEVKSGEIDWVRKYEDAFNKGDIKGIFEAGQNIVKQKIDDIAFERLLAIAKDKTMTSEGGVDFRTMTIELIGKFKDERAFNELKNIADDEEQLAGIRAYAIQQMKGTSNNDKIFNYLVQKLKNTEPLIRSIAAARLGEPGNTKAGPYLIPLLDDKDELVRNRTIRALGAIKYKEATDKLIQKLQGTEENDNIKGIIAEALGQIGDDRAIEPLISLLLSKYSESKNMNEEDFTKYMASKALAIFKDTKAIDALIKVVEEHSYNSIAAAEALGEIGDTRATEAIKKAIEQETDSFAIKKYKEAYKKIIGEEYVEQK